MAYFGIAGSLQSSVTSANTKNIDAPGRAHVYIYNTRRLCHRTFTLSLPTILAQTTQCDMLLRQPGQYFLEGNISCTCTLPEVNSFSPIFEACRRCMLLGLKAVRLPGNKNPTSCDCTHCMSLYVHMHCNRLKPWEHLRTSENPGDAPVLQRYSIIQHQQIPTARHQGTQLAEQSVHSSAICAMCRPCVKPH
jgi:hypothetical protein